MINEAELQVQSDNESENYTQNYNSSKYKALMVAIKYLLLALNIIDEKIAQHSLTLNLRWEKIKAFIHEEKETHSLSNAVTSAGHRVEQDLKQQVLQDQLLAQLAIYQQRAQALQQKGNDLFARQQQLMESSINLQKERVNTVKELFPSDKTDTEIKDNIQKLDQANTPNKEIEAIGALRSPADDSQNLKPSAVKKLMQQKNQKIGLDKEQEKNETEYKKLKVEENKLSNDIKDIEQTINSSFKIGMSPVPSPRPGRVSKTEDEDKKLEWIQTTLNRQKQSENMEDFSQRKTLKK
jgi:hypothetical protein